MIASSVIAEVSHDLNDQVPGYEYTRWSVEQLHSYLREALVAVGHQFQKEFVGMVIVELEPGGDWQKACDCSSIVRIVGESTKSGKLRRYLRKIADVEADLWTGDISHCPARGKDYAIDGYSISVVDDSLFRVYPPVPPNVTKYVLVECFKEPDGYSLDTDVPEKLVVMVKQWMLYRALSVDSENNPTITELANTHQKTYFNLMKALLEAEEREKMLYDDLRAVQKSADK